ncbi:dephospho-CoA kinase [Demequina silvatica]|uniref:dephospho-CoA kinase n=1 Tax=Demequina silvatica TaxID=1638988 RepID=UPI000780F47E|nr:dephospho-CoA kinase [Demequina silvatica]
MLRIGLTGGIASGKSTASARFRELGARVVDHDELARRAVEPGSAALVDIASEFGDRVIADGALDRRALAGIVFRDEGARRRLNAIVHPYVFAMGAAADRQARRDGVDVIVHDIPLLVESGQGPDFDLVVTVAAPEDARVARMVATRGMTEDDARARIRAQATDPERAALADAVLDGSGTVEHLASQVDGFWRLNVPR